MATRVYYSTYKTVYSSAVDWTFDLRWRLLQQYYHFDGDVYESVPRTEIYDT